LPRAQESAAELEYAVRQLGAVGGVLAANVEGTGLSELDLDALWQKLLRWSTGEWTARRKRSRSSRRPLIFSVSS
jgi:hypothetical protein